MPIHGLVNGITHVYPPHFSLEAVVRPNILALRPYRCARDDYQSGILLDANENALGHSIPDPLNDIDMDLHRYPDPAQLQIKERIARLRGVPSTGYVFLGVGSDEVIDLLMRTCCVPGRDKILTTPPSYGMYPVCAQVNDVEVVTAPLNVEQGAFLPKVDEIKAAIDKNPSIKLVFLCSPGNPTGTLIPLPTICEILETPSFKGIVVVDEAYIDFAGENASAVALIEKYANLCVMQTLSKGFGLAAIRVGVALAQPPLIQVLTNTKAPYNISTPTSALALRALSDGALSIMKQKVAALVLSRIKLIASLETMQRLGVGKVIGGNHANFVLVPIIQRDDVAGVPDNKRAAEVYRILAEERGVVVRFRGNEIGCKGCLRITVGTEEENETLIQRLQGVLALV